MTEEAIIIQTNLSAVCSSSSLISDATSKPLSPQIPYQDVTFSISNESRQNIHSIDVMQDRHKRLLDPHDLKDSGRSHIGSSLQSAVDLDEEYILDHIEIHNFYVHKIRIFQLVNGHYVNMLREGSKTLMPHDSYVNGAEDIFHLKLSNLCDEFKFGKPFRILLLQPSSLWMKYEIKRIVVRGILKSVAEEPMSLKPSNITSKDSELAAPFSISRLISADLYFIRRRSTSTSPTTISTETKTKPPSPKKKDKKSKKITQPSSVETSVP